MIVCGIRVMVISHESLMALRARGLYKIGVGDLVRVVLPSERKLVTGSELHAWDIKHNDAPVGRFAVLKHGSRHVAFQLHVHEPNVFYRLDSDGGLTLRSPGSLQLGDIDVPAHDLLAELFKHLGSELPQPHQSAMDSLLSFSRNRFSRRRSKR